MISKLWRSLVNLFWAWLGGIWTAFILSFVGAPDFIAVATGSIIMTILFMSFIILDKIKDVKQLVFMTRRTRK